MRVLIDLNVILDVLLDRAPHAEMSARVLALIETGRVEGCFCAASFATLDYLLAKAFDTPTRKRHLHTVRRLLAVAAVDAQVIDAAMNMGWDDFEDAIVHESARLAGAVAIVTRYPRDYSSATLRVYTPSEFCAAVG
ncbi:MAG: PIN domain-containing protein [Pseudomonadota bacterium]|nr:PIN domain-containing protein [Pseudomonadota bacterium]